MDYFIEIVSGIRAPYFIVALIILTVLGLPWLVIRKHIKNSKTQRILSSLLFSLAFTPGIFGGDKGGSVVPIVYLLPFYADAFWIFVGVASIILVWGVLFIIRSLLSRLNSKRKP